MKYLSAILLALALLAGAYSLIGQNQVAPETVPEDAATATFAGGCFWCTEADFEKVEGVYDAVSGYAGGTEENPTYKQVASGATGHAEVVRVFYDPQRVTYTELLETFWTHVDPTDPNGQFIDRGRQYRSAIFYENKEQEAQAKASIKKLAEAGIFDAPLVTEIVPLSRFYKAEDYHQDYYKKNPIRYKLYRSGSGRDQFLEKAWRNQSFELEPQPTSRN